MGKREDKKIQTRKKILQEAKKSFIENGFEKTKTSYIATRAGIAEGTIFNYFETKVDILIAVITEYFDMDDYPFNSSREADVPSEIYKSIQYYLNNVNLVEKSLLRIVFSSILTRNGDVYQIMQKIDNKIISNYQRYLEKIVPNKSKKELEMMVKIIYSSILFSFGEYMLNERMTSEQLATIICEHVLFILNEKMR